MYYWTPGEYMEDLKRIYPAQIEREGRRWKLCGISYTEGKPCGLYRDSEKNYRAFKTRRKEKK